MLGGQFKQQPHYLPGCLRVEAGRRFIDEQELRVLEQRSGDSDPLALTARKLVSALVNMLGKVDPVEQFEGPADHRLWKSAELAAPEARIAELTRQDVLHHRQTVYQGVLLED